MMTMNTQDVIEEMTGAFLGPDATNRQKYLFEQSLQNLVRIAKAEQKLEIKASVKKLTGADAAGFDLCVPKAMPRN